MSAAAWIIDRGAIVFDALEHRFESAAMRHAVGSVLLASFLASLAVIELGRRGFLPEALAPYVSKSHFGAVALTFTLLLVLEICSLVFAIAASVAESVGKQFELFSLILLRKAFLEVGVFGEPIDWTHVSHVIWPVLADMVGALGVFVAVGLYYRLQRHRRITDDEREQGRFVAAKKVIALVLLAVFALLSVRAGFQFLRGEDASGFFPVFYTVLIFSDVLLVLVALRYSSSYQVVFRNSGFAAATVILRLALTAPEFVNVLLAVGAAAFGIALSLAYNAFVPFDARRSETAEFRATGPASRAPWT